jgi:hypothetical protein
VKENMPTEVQVTLVPDGTVTFVGEAVYFTSADQVACRAFLSANGLSRSRGCHYADDTRFGQLVYGKIPCRPNECWTASFWPR